MAVSGKKEQVNVRLTDEARKILASLSAQKGISQADILEILLRAERDDPRLPGGPR